MMLLKKLCEAHGVSGCEMNISEVIASEMGAFCDEIYKDTIGNLICHKKGSGKKVMFAAHMDSIGLMVTYIEKSGFLRYANVGALSPADALGRHVVFENGCEGIIGCEKGSDEKITQEKMFIDIGASSGEEAEKKVSVGSCARIVSDFVDMGDSIAAASLDNRAGCYALIEAAKQIRSDNDIYFVFTVQEEIGLRGAKCAAYNINPDCAVSIDVTPSGDTPSEEKYHVKCGKGAAIKVMDRSIITGAGIRASLIDAAKDILYQMEVISSGGTDGGAIHTQCGGIETGGVSIPLRYVHSAYEVAMKSDIESVIKLVVNFAEGYNG